MMDTILEMEKKFRVYTKQCEKNHKKFELYNKLCLFFRKIHMGKLSVLYLDKMKNINDESKELCEKMKRINEALRNYIFNKE